MLNILHFETSTRLFLWIFPQCGQIWYIVLFFPERVMYSSDFKCSYHCSIRNTTLIGAKIYDFCQRNIALFNSYTPQSYNVQICATRFLARHFAFGTSQSIFCPMSFFYFTWPLGIARFQVNFLAISCATSAQSDKKVSEQVKPWTVELSSVQLSKSVPFPPQLRF